MKKHIFPNGFLWGTSTAAHQVEGNNFASDWWNWEHRSANRPKSGIACDHYRLFKSDFALAKKWGHNSHRLSIEWARIEPSEGKFNQREIQHYQNVLKELKRLRLKSFVTLWHFTLPNWFADKGGFGKKSNLRFFERYVKKCEENFRGLVDFWVTINEPTTYVLKSYLVGIWPPGKKNLLKSFEVYKNLGVAHNLAYEVLKKENKNNKVGAAHQLISYYSVGGVVNDFITKIFNYFANDYFYRITFGNHDFMGLNYYFKIPVSYKYFFKKVDKSDYEKIVRDEGKKLGWDMNPEGLYDCIKYLQSNFRAPIYVLEHGISDPSDRKRPKYIKTALSAVIRSISEGADVRGYLHWTLIDNFEWNLGYLSKFGMFSFNPKTKNREAKKSAFIFSKIAKENAI